MQLGVLVYLPLCEFMGPQRTEMHFSHDYRYEVVRDMYEPLVPAEESYRMKSHILRSPVTDDSASDVCR